MACVAMSQIVKQTISVRSGNGLRLTMPATASVGELLPVRTRVCLVRSNSGPRSGRSTVSFAEYGTLKGSESPRYWFIFMPRRSRLWQSTAISPWRDFPLPLRRSFPIPRSRYGESSLPCARGGAGRWANHLREEWPKSKWLFHR
jgi:hypothetical protein